MCYSNPHKDIASSFWILILMLFVAFPGLAQQPHLVKGKVLDIATKQPVEGVNILVKNSNFGSTSDSSGTFLLRLSGPEADLVFSHISYQTRELKLKDLTGRENMVVHLVPVSFNLNEAIITAKRQFSYSILDFNFVGNNILLLAWKHRNNTLELLLINEAFDTLARLANLPEKRQVSLFRDCFGNCHILCRKNVYQIHAAPDSLQLYPPVDRERFLRLMQNCMCSTGDYLIYKREGLNQFQHNYLAIHRETSAVIEFISEMEEEKLYAFHDEMRFIQMNPAAFPSRGGRSLARAYAREIAFKAAQNHIARIGNSIYYFSHGSDRLINYSKLLNIIDIVPIDYHTRESWLECIMIDRPQEKAYTCFELRGRKVVSEIDLHTGDIYQKAIIPLNFPEKLKIHNGYVYFLYKELGNIWAKQELYRIKL